MEQKRIQWPDLAKGIGILLVVLGHAVIYTDSAGGVSDYLEQRIWNHINLWIYSFHMPLFIFVSGILQGYSEQKKSKINTKDIINKIRVMSILRGQGVFSNNLNNSSRASA